MFLAEDIAAYDMVWLVGDNFMAKSFCNHFKKIGDYHMKTHFDAYPHCSSKYSSSDTNMLNRIKNSFANTVGAHGKLPKFVVIILDMDLFDFLQFEGQGVVTLLGGWIEWLVLQFEQFIQDCLALLPQRCIKDGYPQWYWVALPHHHKFHDNKFRTNMVHSIESVCKLHTSVRVVRMKEAWEYDNDDLVDENGMITNYGLTKYWRSIDLAFQFNARKREMFLARNLTRKEIAKDDVKKANAQHLMEDDIRVSSIFARHKHHNRYKWSSKANKQHSTPVASSGRKLPTPPGSPMY